MDKALLSPHTEVAVGMCVKDRELMRHVIQASGFRFKIEGVDAKMKPGLVGERAGDKVQLCLDVSRLEPGDNFVVILGHLISYEHMGTASLHCLGDCSCSPSFIDAHVPGGKFSVFKAKTFPVTRTNKSATITLARANCSCVLELIIIEHSSSGEFKFKILSLMTASQEGSLRYGHQTGFNVRPMEARLL